jgi:hypothetical protein
MTNMEIAAITLVGLFVAAIIATVIAVFGL